jgi:nucleotide-binding universal stress UspA family protein
MIKDVILNLEHDKSRDGVRDYAISLAEAFDAHLTGVALADGTNNLISLMAEFSSVRIADLLSTEQEVARNAIERYEAAVKGRHLSVEHRLVMQSAVGAPTKFSAMARRYDLSVIMQSGDEKCFNNDKIIESTLFESGRPILVFPYIQTEELNLDRIVCCWDGSRAAARAINDAIPILKKSKDVELLIASNGKTAEEQVNHGVELSSHLNRHGISVEVEIVQAEDIDVTNVILSRVADTSASMIVMGGYGHSRLREFILGGVTHGLLATMTVPVFISH